MRALLLDDEAPAQSVLLHLLAAYCPEVTVVAHADDSVLGLELIRAHRPDLLFLDIEMPRLNGFEVLRALGPDADRLHVVVVTAYNQYAIRAIRFAALDYLLKPVDPDELTAAVARAAELTRAGRLPVEPAGRYAALPAPGGLSARPTRLSLPTAEGLLVVPVMDVQCCEATGSYTLIYLRDRPQPVVVTRLLKEYDNLLTRAGYPFFRVHNSWLINLAEVRRYIRGDGGIVELNNGQQIDVAKRRKEEFLAALSQM